MKRIKKSDLASNVYRLFAVYYPTENIYSVPFYAQSFEHAKSRIYTNVISGLMPDLIFKPDTILREVAVMNFVDGSVVSSDLSSIKIFDIPKVKEFYENIKSKDNKDVFELFKKESKGDN